MPSKEDIKGKVIELLGGGIENPRQPRRKIPRRRKENAVQVRGSNNVVHVAAGDVHINHQVVTRPIIQPDPNAISAAQARHIQNAIERVVNIEAVAGLLDGDRQKLFAKWYRAIKDRYEAPSYRAIRAWQGDEVLAWLALMEQACLELRDRLQKARGNGAGSEPQPR